MPSRRPKPNAPGRPKDLEKRAAILAAAKTLFPQRGYEGTSMDAIAQAAGVSKLTVYSHFQDKDTLFVEAVKGRCEELMPPELFVARVEGPAREQLERIAHAFFRLITSHEAVAMHRMMSVQLPEGSQLPRLFWEAGPRRTVELLAEFLRVEHEAGVLQVPDPALAASQFFCLLKGEYHARQTCGYPLQWGDADIERHVSATVDLFLRAHGPARR
jgi:TetR/AcrR family transcriptional repressor of mexJK operon